MLTVREVSALLHVHPNTKAAGRQRHTQIFLYYYQRRPPVYVQGYRSIPYQDEPSRSLVNKIIISTRLSWLFGYGRDPIVNSALLFGVNHFPCLLTLARSLNPEYFSSAFPDISNGMPDI